MLEASAVLSAGVSVDVFVFLSRGKLPTTARWQHALDRLGVDVQLDASVDAGSHTWFWPARVAGRTSGFEFFLGPISDVFGRASPSGLDERDLVADFVTHNDLSELQCSMFAAAALGVEADGVVFDGETESLIPPEQLLEQARAIDFT